MANEDVGPWLSIVATLRPDLVFDIVFVEGGATEGWSPFLL